MCVSNDSTRIKTTSWDKSLFMVTENLSERDNQSNCFTSYKFEAGSFSLRINSMSYKCGHTFSLIRFYEGRSRTVEKVVAVGCEWCERGGTRKRQNPELLRREERYGLTVGSLKYTTKEVLRERL